jgi:hypothetical protein
VVVNILAPAGFTLIAAMSPSPGGYFQDLEKECTWSTPAPLSGAGAGKRRGVIHERPPSEACLRVARVILRLARQHEPGRQHEAVLRFVSTTPPRPSARTVGPLRYYAPIEGHELPTRGDLIPSEPDHPRAGQWYYKLQLGPLARELPPIVANRWRRVTFIITSGDRFVNAVEINDLFEQESPVGQLYVRLKELGIAVEREWWIGEEGAAHPVDLALPTGAGCLPVTFGDRLGADQRPALFRQGRRTNLALTPRGRKHTRIPASTFFLSKAML